MTVSTGARYMVGSSMTWRVVRCGGWREVSLFQTLIFIWSALEICDLFGSAATACQVSCIYPCLQPGSSRTRRRVCWPCRGRIL